VGRLLSPARESKTRVGPHCVRQKPGIGGKIRAANQDSGGKISVVKRNRGEGPVSRIMKSAEERSVRKNQKSEKRKTRALI
jgi:hypothetical protein